MEDLKPGRELDALIAEKVMGVPSALEPGISQAEYELRRKRWHEPYSTDIAAAWEVVEKLRVSHWNFTLNCHHGKWIVLLDNETYGSEVEAGTAPHAICLAALKAVGA